MTGTWIDILVTPASRKVCAYLCDGRNICFGTLGRTGETAPGLLGRAPLISSNLLIYEREKSEREFGPTVCSSDPWIRLTMVSGSE